MAATTNVSYCGVFHDYYAQVSRPLKILRDRLSQKRQFTMCDRLKSATSIQNLRAKYYYRSTSRSILYLCLCLPARVTILMGSHLTRHRRPFLTSSSSTPNTNLSNQKQENDCHESTSDSGLGRMWTSFTFHGMVPRHAALGRTCTGCQVETHCRTLVPFGDCHAIIARIRRLSAMA